jgi:hypothetical protein
LLKIFVRIGAHGSDFAIGIQKILAAPTEKVAQYTPL